MHQEDYEAFGADSKRDFCWRTY